MAGSATLGFNCDGYVRLPAVKIRTTDEAEATEEQIVELLARPALSSAERSYVDLLSDLLADPEDATLEIPDVHGVELVRALLEERGLRQKDLVGVFPRSRWRPRCWRAAAS